MAKFKERDDNIVEAEIMECPVGPSGHKWLVGINQGDATLKLAPGEICPESECERGIDPEYLDMNPIAARIAFDADHLHLGSCDDPCDCNWWWNIEPEAATPAPEDDSLPFVERLLEALGLNPKFVEQFGEAEAIQAANTLRADAHSFNFGSEARDRALTEVEEAKEIVTQFAYETWWEDCGLAVWADPRFAGIKEVAQERQQRMINGEDH